MNKVMASTNRLVVYTAGCAPASPGYPNATNTVRRLKSSEGFSVRDHCYWIESTGGLWRILDGNLVKRLFFLIKVSVLSLLSVTKVLLESRRETSQSVIYLPYPSVFPALLLGCVPSRFRPPIVSDFYISIFDSAFRNRQLTKGRLLEKIVYTIEKWSLIVASVILVDTEGTKESMSSLFSIKAAKFLSTPLAINDNPLDKCRELAQRKSNKLPVVLFVGTLVPLHGIDCILEAVSLASLQRQFRFVLAGDGQESLKVKEFIASNPEFPIFWRKDWLDEKSIVDLIWTSDLCLGIFGNSEKARRVFPLKNYIYLRCGRPVLTQREFSLPLGVDRPPIITCEANSTALAEQIVELLDNPEKLEELGASGKTYFECQLGIEATLSIWKEIFVAASARRKSE